LSADYLGRVCRQSQNKTVWGDIIADSEFFGDSIALTMKDERMKEDKLFSDPFKKIEEPVRTKAMKHYEAVVGGDEFYNMWKKGAKGEYRKDKRKESISKAKREES
jgi:hypothetical protein